MPRLRYIIKNSIKQGQKILGTIWERADALYNRIPPGGRIPALCGCCLFLALILGMLVTALVTGHRQNRPPFQDAAAAFQPLTIPLEELFLPGEPDFLPEILFERERRTAWTAVEAQPFWTDPLDYGAEVWRNGIKSAVDELLERIP